MKPPPSHYLVPNLRALLPSSHAPHAPYPLPPRSTCRWRKVGPLVKSFLGNSLHLLLTMTDAPLIAFALRRLRARCRGRGGGGGDRARCSGEGG